MNINGKHAQLIIMKVLAEFQDCIITITTVDTLITFNGLTCCTIAFNNLQLSRLPIDTQDERF